MYCFTYIVFIIHSYYQHNENYINFKSNTIISRLIKNTFRCNCINRSSLTKTKITCIEKTLFGYTDKQWCALLRETENVNAINRLMYFIYS